MLITKIIRLILLTLLTTQLAFAHGGKHLGKINFPTSGSKEAQVFFESGLMLLHSFEYSEARAEFQKAEQLDPNFALAYWGEAMTYNHPLWAEQDPHAALSVLNKLSPTSQGRLQKANTEKEKALINAINILYGKGDKRTRDYRYADAMREIYRHYPNDDEIASFYALALLGTTESERDTRIYMQAAGIADEIFSRNPSHPGALHYALHSYDDPIHAPLGLRAARMYAKVAPDASHALHMPSHIFMAMGMWDEVITSNLAAWQAGLKENPNGNANAYTIDDLHALHWLSYGNLQKQNNQKALELTKKMEEIAIKSKSPMAKWYYAMMRADYITNTHDFKVDLKTVDMTQIELSARASDLYTNALIALNDNKVQAAKDIQHYLLKIIPSHFAKKDVYQDYFTSITKSGITTAKIMALELEAQIALREGKKQYALQLLNKATKLEDQTSFGYGPPIPVKPAYELSAEFLLKEKKYADAFQAYIVTLKRLPHRLLAEKGLKQTEDTLRKAGQPIPQGITPYFNRLMLPEFYH